MAPQIVKGPPTPPPILVLREAIIWAQLKGYRIRIGAPGYGVQCTSTHARECWERVPLEEGIDPVGAVILQHQPRQHLPVEAAANALGGSDAWIPWVEGVTDGLDGVAKNPTWIRHPVPRHVSDRYQNGFENGALLRIALLSRRCPRHGMWPLTSLHCPACGSLTEQKVEEAAPRGEA